MKPCVPGHSEGPWRDPTRTDVRIAAPPKDYLTKPVVGTPWVYSWTRHAGLAESADRSSAPVITGGTGSSSTVTFCYLPGNWTVPPVDVYCGAYAPDCHLLPHAVCHDAGCRIQRPVRSHLEAHS